MIFAVNKLHPEHFMLQATVFTVTGITWERAKVMLFIIIIMIIIIIEKIRKYIKYIIHSI